MRLSFLPFFATVVSVAEGSALRGFDPFSDIDGTKGESSFDGESRIAADSPPEELGRRRNRVKDEDVDDVDSRPFLKTRPPKTRTLLSRVLETLDYKDDVDEYDRCEGDCDEDKDCAGSLVCFQR